MWPRTSRPGLTFALAFVLTLVITPSPRARDHAQLGQAWTRNMISTETGLPESFDPITGRNIRWRARLGTETHATPVVADGRIYVGTNNGEPRDPRHQGDRGVLMCLDERTGDLLWQLVVPKRVEDIYFDWPKSGISSTATVEGDRFYLVDNRGVVLCLDTLGLANGNDGPFRNEAFYYAPQPTNDLAQGAPAGFNPDGSLRAGAPEPTRVELGPKDADIVWFFDLSSGAGIWSHDAAHSSILVHGDYLYLNTGTGVDNTHRNIRRPEAPSLVALDKRTGRLVAREREAIGPNIFHSTWAPPSLASIQGQDRLFFAAGNGFVYAFEPYTPRTTSTADHHGNTPVATLRSLWQFDFDPSGPKSDVHRFHLNKSEGPSNFYGAPVFHDGHLYVAGGGDLWWGKNEAWLICLDVRGTQPEPRWKQPLERHTFSTPAVDAGLVFVTDCSQNLHCFDASTGAPRWKAPLRGETWASPLLADGKVYVGTRRGFLHVFAASREMKTLAEIPVGSPISATTIAANGVLYVASMTELFAVAPVSHATEPTPK